MPKHSETRQPHDIAGELLVLHARSGDADAFARLVRVWTPRLSRHAGRWLADPALAADAVQEAWVAIARSLGRLDDPARFPAWAFRLTQHKCVDLIRKDARHAGAIRRHAASQPRTEESGDADDKVDRLRAALRTFDPERRALLALHYVDGLSVAQLAEVFAVPRGTVKSRLYHARNELKAVLEAQGGTP